MSTKSHPALIASSTGVRAELIRSGRLRPADEVAPSSPHIDGIATLAIPERDRVFALKRASTAEIGPHEMHRENRRILAGIIDD